MTTLTTTKCVTHTPQMSAISTTHNMSFDEQFTFCTTCEQNIERWADMDNPYSPWSKWTVSE
jgi:hypothetical protein